MKKKTESRISAKNIKKTNTHPEFKTQSDQAYHSIKDKILFCDLFPGEEVSEAQMVSRFDLGKASVRSALTRLVQDGLVRVIPRSGYIITPLTIRDIHEAFEYRTILEVAAVRKAAGCIDADNIRHLDKVCMIGYDPDNRESQKAYLQANHKIHMTIAKASGNSRLAEGLERVLDEMCRMLYMGMCYSDKSDEWKHGHEDILSALVSGDAKEAVRITREQLESGLNLVLKAAMTSPDVSQVNIVPASREKK
jgi:DNA-binding GntR family transcriptional regulator